MIIFISYRKDAALNKKYYKELVKGSLGEAFKENNSPGARRDARLKRKNAYLQKTMAKYRKAAELGIDPSKVNQRRDEPTPVKEDGVIVPGVNTTVDVKPGETERQAAKFGNGKIKELMPKARKNSKPNTLYNMGLAEKKSK